jgi:transposase-like protein
LGSYAAALERRSELARTEREQVRSVLRCNTRVEQPHQRARVRELMTRRFEPEVSAQRPFTGRSGRPNPSRDRHGDKLRSMAPRR